jgi:hypothetical protein
MKKEKNLCVIYECRNNEKGICRFTDVFERTTPDSVICDFRNFTLSERTFTQEMIEDRIMVRNLLNAARKGE